MWPFPSSFSDILWVSSEKEMELPYSLIFDMLCFATTVFLWFGAGKHLGVGGVWISKIDLSKFISQLLYSKRCHILLLGSLVWNCEGNWQAASADCLAKYYCKILPVQKLHSFTVCYVSLWVNQRGTNFWSFASDENQDQHVFLALRGTIMLLCCCCLFQPLGLVFLQWYFSISCSLLWNNWGNNYF